MNTPLILPPLGDGEHLEGEIISIIGEGEKIEIGDTLMEVETDKVVVEVPSPLTGTIASIDLKVGDKVKGGVTYGNLIVDSEGLESDERVLEVTTSSNEEVAPRIDSRKRSTTADQAGVSDLKTFSLRSLGDETANVPTHTGMRAPAGPAARNMARRLGVDILDVRGTRPRGRITKEDVVLHARSLIRQVQGKQGLSTERKLPDPGKFGPIHKEPLTGIAKVTSRNMQLAWTEVPHAWIQEDVDLTEIEALRKQCRKTPSVVNVPLTVTAILCKVVAVALGRFPQFNCVLDAEREEIIYRDYTNVGVAVDTKRGLVVPVLKNVDQKSALKIAEELKAISEKAKSSTLSMEDLQGSSFTISNLGGIGVAGMFPIVNWPEVAILGVGTSRSHPVFAEGMLSERLIMSVTLGFDHRVINGADAARFLKFIKNCLEDLGTLLFDT